MNKTEFLDELKNCLAVLEEKEQQDILEEYTQHIDMKMERGLSEEEAIGDFGDLDELVAEICTIPYIIQSKFAGIKLYGWLPVATRRANLAQVLFAIGAHAKTDQNGVLRIESLWDGVSSSIPPEAAPSGTPTSSIGIAVL